MKTGHWAHKQVLHHACMETGRPRAYRARVEGYWWWVVAGGSREPDQLAIASLAYPQWGVIQGRGGESADGVSITLSESYGSCTCRCSQRCHYTPSYLHGILTLPPVSMACLLTYHLSDFPWHGLPCLLYPWATLLALAWLSSLPHAFYRLHKFQCCALANSIECVPFYIDWHSIIWIPRMDCSIYRFRKSIWVYYYCEPLNFPDTLCMCWLIL